MSGKLPESEIIALQVEERIEFANAWLDAAEEIALKTGHHPEAVKLVNYADSHVALGVPVTGGILDLYPDEPNPDIDYFYLTPIMNIDIMRLDGDDERLEFLTDTPPAIARFMEGSRAVYLSQAPISRLGRGIILLHELGHVVRHPGGSAPTVDEQEVWLEEVDIFAFEFELLEELLGSTYRRAVGRFNPSDKNPDYTAVEKLFVRKLDATSADIDFWLGMYTLNGLWRYLEQHESNPRIAFAKHFEDERHIGIE